MEGNGKHSAFIHDLAKTTLSPQPPYKWTDSTIEQHDLNNFECKVDYHIEPDLRENRYEMSIFFFIPNSLNVNKQTYSEKEFFGDMTTYLRFKTPQMALAGLLHEDNVLSPFFLIDQNLEKIRNGYTEEKLANKINKGKEKTGPLEAAKALISYELRVLGSIVKVTLRDQFEYYFQEGMKEDQHEKVFSQLKAYLKEIELLQQKMVSLKDDIAHVQIPHAIRESLSFVDDYIGRQIEERLTKSISLFRSMETFQKICFEDISTRIKTELERRTKTNSRFSLQKDSSAQKRADFSYWERILKKYVQSVLYLDIRAKDQTSGALDVLFSFAAGAAMFVSILLGFFVVDQLQDNVYAYITALTVAYMLKDRLKELIRNASLKIVQKYFPDKRYGIYDIQQGVKIGTGKESVRFISWKDIPPEIINIRESSNRASIEREGKPENVIRYVKNVRLFPEKIKEYHARHGDLNAIMRFNVQHLLQYTDDPIQMEELWDPASKILSTIPCEKYYHLNLIFRVQTPASQSLQNKTYYKRIRVILNQQGIQKVEELPVLL
jgi:hypothetical protein